MNKWEKTARLVMEANGLTLDSNIEKAFWKMTDFDCVDATIDTNSRDGDFINLVIDGTTRILKKVKGKPVFIVSDEEGESVYCFFGNKAEVLTRIAKVVKKEKVAQNSKKFHEPMTMDQIWAYGRRWLGTKIPEENRDCFPQWQAFRNYDKKTRSERGFKLNFTDFVANGRKGKSPKVSVLFDPYEEVFFNTHADIETFLTKLGL